MEKDNKLIAEFMGLDKEYKMRGVVDYYCPYNVSWDWLMPVVSHILWLEEYEDESYEDIHNGLTNALLSQTYDAVVEFIKSHNK